MKIQLRKLQLQHTIMMSEMQLHSRLAKTLEHLLRQELSSVEGLFVHKEPCNELHIHSKLAKRLEDLLRQELSCMEKCFQEMENFSIELLRLRKEELEGSTCQNA